MTGAPAKGTYALLLALPAPVDVAVGKLGILTFREPWALYVGSAFGSGGLASRLAHHASSGGSRPHWHVDYLHGSARLEEAWLTDDPRRLECLWAGAVAGVRGARPVPGFGCSDCGCESHLVGFARRPTLATFRRRAGTLVDDLRPVRRRTAAELVARTPRAGMVSGKTRS